MLDEKVALSEIARSIGQVFFEYSPGVSQALIFALLGGALPTKSQASGPEVAFQCWDEACQVLATRLPRLSSADDRENPYSPDSGTWGAISQANIEISMIESVVSEVVHPLREQKRRALITFQQMLELRPAETAEALVRILPELVDPLDITSVLMIILKSSTANEVAPKIANQLGDLVQSRYLSVATAAHDLVKSAGISVPVGPLNDSHLLEGRTDANASPKVRSIDLHRAELEAHETDSIVGSRLDYIDSRYPYLAEDILDSISRRFDEPAFDERMREQLESARPIIDFGMDIRVSSDEVAEEELQKACGSLKARAWAHGDGVVSDDDMDGLGRSIALDPHLPLTIEKIRQPRPDLPELGEPNSEFWSFLDNHNVSRSQQRLRSLVPSPWPGMTIGIEELRLEQCVVVENSEFTHWRLIGYAEQQRYVVDSLRNKGAEVSHYAGLQLHGLTSGLGDRVPPVLIDDSSSLTDWECESSLIPYLGESASVETFVNVDHLLVDYGDHRRGLGLPASIVSPSVWLRQRLNLRQHTDFILSDSEGAAVALVAWRSEYHQPYSGIPFAKRAGTGLIIRADLFEQIANDNATVATFRRAVVIPNSTVPSLFKVASNGMTTSNRRGKPGRDR
jgi:hypothetical protein